MSSFVMILIIHAAAAADCGLFGSVSAQNVHRRGVVGGVKPKTHLFTGARIYPH